MCELKLTVLVENTAPDSLAHAHGLSVWVEHRDTRCLLDAGPDERFARNADTLGIDLARANLAVLSHGHYDHGDGLDVFFRRNAAARVHARTAATQPEYHGERYIGVKPELFAQYSNRFVFSDEPEELAPGLWIVPDQVNHEQSLVTETREGLVILNSCCHAGADHVVESVKACFPDTPVRALIGGFHLMGERGTSTMGPAPALVLYLDSRLFGSLAVDHVWTGHCTGVPAFSLLQGAFPHRVSPLTSGLVLTF